MEKIKVIIIDDEMLIRKLIRMKMDLEGLNLELAGEYQDGADAIEALQDIRPDIIVSDICMPEVDGLSFSENCIKRFPNINLNCRPLLWFKFLLLNTSLTFLHGV